MPPASMLRLTEIRLALDHDAAALRQAVADRLGAEAGALIDLRVFRRAVDARKRGAVRFSYSVDVTLTDAAAAARVAAGTGARATPDSTYRFVAHLPARAPANPLLRPVVIGAGPCGLFAGLLLAQMGFRPLILERGRVVRERTKDTWALWRRGVLDPGSNVQFGEGGAGTFSDGKLYSQIKDPHHLGRKVLEEFVAAGAPADILTEAHPHIGTFRLVAMVERLRASIEALGGSYRFGAKVADIAIERDDGGAARVRGVVLESGETIAADHVVLAVGHSARETFAMLERRGVAIDAKPFSIGVRIEHPQSLIDRARYGAFAGHARLGAAEYKLAHHCLGSGAASGRTVYSFCMCPGGTVVAATSEPGRVVTNGMSQYSRNERNANAGLVVGITPRDYAGGAWAGPGNDRGDHPGDGVMAGVAFQRHWESRAFAAGGGNYAAPVQLVGDFLAGRPSTRLGSVVPSYRPGVTPTDLSLCLPDFAVAALREALPAFARSIAGYAMSDAVLTGVETRTSAPVRIGRGGDFQSLNTRGLYPAGEGAGYAGGILSAGVDGIKVAQAVARAIVAESTPDG